MLPNDAADRFRANMDALWRDADLTWSDDRRIALAVSGGPDSMAMLSLASATYPDRTLVATFDHQLRAGSGAEAEMVARVCATLGLPHVTLHPDAPVSGSSLQMRARDARYTALARWAAGRADALLTAHHADDQAETLLMRLNRASGVTGLAGIRPHRDEGGVTILRPLLAWRRAELRGIAEASGLPFVDDPSNADPRHDRTRIRTLLADHPELDSAALAASARWLLDAENAIAYHVRRAWEDRWDGGAIALGIDELPREITRRLVRRAIAEVRDCHGIILPPFGDASNIESLLDAMELGRGAVHGGVQAVRSGDLWHFRPAPPRRSR